MSSAGGRLVVLDRAGREVRAYPLRAGLATLGSDHACDIRVMLPDVAKHHATIAVHQAQTVIRNVEGSATLVNGAAVSVAALRHGDVITLADRRLRWEYDDPTGRRQPRGASPSVKQLAPVGAGGRGGGGGGRRRGSEGPGGAGGALHRDRALQLALEMNHRASMPGSSGGKQVAIVQPQRRDTSEHIDMEQSRCSPQPKRAGRSAADGVPAHTTQATLWIESRKTTPRRAKTESAAGGGARRSLPGGARARKATPLRMAVLRRAHRPPPSLVKIQAPLTIDYTKQAAIMLMTGHTKSKLSKSPSYVVKKPSPVRKTPRTSRGTSGGASRRTPRGSSPRTPVGPPPRTPAGPSPRTSGSTANRGTRSTGNQSVTILEITDSESHRSALPSVSTRSSASPQKSPALLSPKKSALKDTSKKTIRKTESIKFDLSNLENHQESNIVSLSESTKNSDTNVSEEDITLRYSESSAPSPSPSPSPRHSIHSRSSRILEKLGSTVTLSPSRTLTPNSPSSRRSARGSFIVQKALDGSTLTDYTRGEESVATSAYRTRTLSPRKNMESYSIVDLVSLESNDASVYSSADSTTAGDYGTPQTSASLRRTTRSTINPSLVGSSTPYLDTKRQTRSRSNLTGNVSARSSVSKRRSKSLTTPENQPVSVSSARVSRRSRSRSRINDSDLLLLDDTELDDSSPKTSKRPRSTKSNVSNLSEKTTNTENDPGMSTPENRGSPGEVGTPVLSIQSLLNSSRSSSTSQASTKRGRRTFDSKRKTIGVISEPRTRATRATRANKSLGFSAKKTVLRLSRGPSENSDKTDEGAPQPDNEETVTPKSAIKPVPEGVKNKHSTAKKPQSKRSLIDNLDQSDIVKQLFNSPVKRKLSQSMTEFSRRQLSEDEEGAVGVRRATRSTAGAGGGGGDDSLTDNDAVFTPERFVSPIQTPGNSPNMSGIKRLFKKITPNDDLRDGGGVRSPLRSPRARRSAGSDSPTLTGVKAVFARSPRNRLSDVRVKEVFAASPANDLRRVSGVKALFRENRSPKNDLTNVRGVKQLFAETSPRNDLRNVSGVKRTFERRSPRNDLTDVRGVRRMFGHAGRARRERTVDVSGVEELFDESTPSAHDSEALFDRLVGKPVIKAVYSKTFCNNKPKKRRRARSLRTSIDVITNNVEEWLERELQKRLHKNDASTSRVKKELQRLATDTVQGEEPIRLSRTRNSSMKKCASEASSAHSLPIKKRSLVQTSMETSENKLPIKKRAVVHSTPVKGRVNVTMNASELGRVSPIAVLDHTRDNVRATRQMPTVEEKGKPTRAAATKPPTPKPSPKKSPPKRVTRKRKTVEPIERNAKRRRSSLVITKKIPAMSPKPDPKAPAQTDSSNQKRTRSTRAKTERTIETPKKSRTRAQKATVVVPKPSPQLKPRRGNRPLPEPERPPELTTKESPKRSQRGRKTKVETEPKPEEKPKRTRKTTARSEPSTAAPEEPATRTRRGRAELTTTTLEVKPTRRNNRVDIDLEASSKSKRGRAKRADNIGAAEETEPSRPPAKRTRARPDPTPTPAPSVGRRATTRATAATSDTTDTQTKGRKRKAATSEQIPTKVSKTETSKRKATLTKDNRDDSNNANKTVRGRRKVEVPKSPAASVGKSTRGKKVAIVEPKANSTEVGKGKRETAAKESRRKASPAVAAVAVESPVKRTRGRAPPPESVVVSPAARAGRNRRR